MPDFPPLMTGLATAGDPFAAAIELARDGCEGGTILHRPDEAALLAALILAPDVPLKQAMAMALAAQCAFGDAFGALAPAEIALHFEWPGGFRINGALCGTLRAAAATADANAVPGWLVLGLHVPFHEEAAAEPGDRPDETTLREEGVGDLATDDLLGAWARHMMSWIDVWQSGGIARIHETWRSRAWTPGDQVEIRLPNRARRGIYRGLDEDGGLLLEIGERTQLIALTEMLEPQ